MFYRWTCSDSAIFASAYNPTTTITMPTKNTTVTAAYRSAVNPTPGGGGGGDYTSSTPSTTTTTTNNEDGSTTKTTTNADGSKTAVTTAQGGCTATVKTVDNTKSFGDVTGGEWYTDNVAWAASHEVMNGMGDGTSARADLSRFSDADRVSVEARDAMAWAVAVGIINGSTDENGNVILDAQGTATRAQIAAITQRFCEKVTK